MKPELQILLQLIFSWLQNLSLLIQLVSNYHKSKVIEHIL